MPPDISRDPFGDMLRVRFCGGKFVAGVQCYACIFFYWDIPFMLWMYFLWPLSSCDGILTVNAILKIQCCWRGYKGRQIAAQKYMFFLTEKMEIIRGLCRCWKVGRGCAAGGIW